MNLIQLLLLTLFISFQNLPAHSNARDEWSSLPHEMSYCLKRLVEKTEQSSIAYIISLGISPYDAAYANSFKTCQKLADGPRQNFECTLTDETGKNVKTICNEYFAVENYGEFSKVSSVQAFTEIINDQKVRVLNEENEQGKQQRFHKQFSQIEERLKNNQYYLSELVGRCSELYNEWKNAAGFRAFVVSANGACGSSYNHANRQAAEHGAIQECFKYSNSANCYVIASQAGQVQVSQSNSTNLVNRKSEDINHKSDDSEKIESKLENYSITSLIVSIITVFLTALFLTIRDDLPFIGGLITIVIFVTFFASVIFYLGSFAGLYAWFHIAAWISSLMLIGMIFSGKGSGGSSGGGGGTGIPYPAKLLGLGYIGYKIGKKMGSL